MIIATLFDAPCSITLSRIHIVFSCKRHYEDIEIDASKYNRKVPAKRTRRRARQPDTDSDDDAHNEKLLLSMSELKVISQV